MKLIENIDDMRNVCEQLRAKGKLIRLVPTMGALHAGHSSLIEEAKREDIRCDLEHGCSMLNISQIKQSEPRIDVGQSQVVVIVSIFVNPLQFNNNQDFLKYPSTRQKDLDLCEKLKVNFIFAPKLEQIYPDLNNSHEHNEQCMILPIEILANDLEGRSRPGHFRGMLTVVCKLFNIIRPHDAYFGEKDYQQLLLVTRMSRDLSMGVRIVPVETIRDYDMLPLSSRNIRLDGLQRNIAPVIYSILDDARQAIESLDISSSNNTVCLDIVILSSMITTMSCHLHNLPEDCLRVDYLELRCSNDFTKIEYNQEINLFDCERNCSRRQEQIHGTKTLKTRLLISVILGEVRLLDNMEVSLNRHLDLG